MKPKITILSETSLETGRGPLFRLAGILPHLARHYEVALFSLGTPDAGIARIASECQVPVRTATCVFDGWRLVNKVDIVSAVRRSAIERGDRLVVLAWELWDLMRGLGEALSDGPSAFATVVHATPFLNCPPRPRTYAFDVIKRLAREPSPAIRRYIAANAWRPNAVLRRTHVIVPNETVAFYFDHYFPRIRYLPAWPGYGLDMDAIAAAPAGGDPVDFAFMAKLVPEKGIFELLTLFAAIRERLPTARLRVIGSFAEDSERVAFQALAHRLGVEPAVDLAGWLTGDAKYAALKTASVFLYPARATDTFCIGMLEALACGLPVVCWDVPFVHQIYAGAPVVPVPLGDSNQFVAEALTARERAPAASPRFLAHYDGWERAAEQEMAAYERIMARG